MGTMNLRLFDGRGLLPRAESGDRPPYDGAGEGLFAVLGCGLWFSATFIRLSLNGQGWTLGEKLLEASGFVLFAALPIFGLATPWGERLTQRWLLKRHGLWFQTGVCAALLLFISLVKATQSPERFRFLSQLDSLILPQMFWLNTGLLIAATFAALRIPFWVLDWRRRPEAITPAQDFRARSPRLTGEFLALTGFYLLYMIAVNTPILPFTQRTDQSGYGIALAYLITLGLAAWPITQRTAPKRFMPFDFLLAALCLYSMFGLTRPMFRFGVFIPVVLFIVVVIYGIGLGRSHFGFSFQPRRCDVVYVIKLIAIALLLLIPIALGLGFIRPNFAITEAGGLGPWLLRLISFAILFSFRVGVFEEVLFRSGLLVGIRDLLQGYAEARRGANSWANSWGDRRWQLLWAALIGSVIFGLAHLGNEPSSGELSPLAFKLAYLVLATAASMFYALAFVETNRLWGSIVIHGFVDTTAVVLLGAELVVPF
jgi:membrane protease YdiL (CAAX protease family)